MEKQTFIIIFPAISALLLANHFAVNKYELQARSLLFINENEMSRLLVHCEMLFGV